MAHACSWDCWGHVACPGGLSALNLCFSVVCLSPLPQRLVSIGGSELPSRARRKTNRNKPLRTSALRHTIENKDFKPPTPLGMQPSPNNPTAHRVTGTGVRLRSRRRRLASGVDMATRHTATLRENGRCHGKKATRRFLSQTNLTATPYACMTRRTGCFLDSGPSWARDRNELPKSGPGPERTSPTSISS